MNKPIFENPIWYESIRLLKTLKKPFWRRVLELANKPRRKRIRVNIHKINIYGEEGKIIIIPGKLLGGERLKKKIKIVAIDGSKKVIEQIRRDGGEFIYLKDFLKNLDSNIKYSDLIIIR